MAYADSDAVQKLVKELLALDDDEIAQPAIFACSSQVFARLSETKFGDNPDFCAAPLGVLKHVEATLLVDNPIQRLRAIIDESDAGSPGVLSDPIALSKLLLRLKSDADNWREFERDAFSQRWAVILAPPRAAFSKTRLTKGRATIALSACVYGRYFAQAAAKTARPDWT